MSERMTEEGWAELCRRYERHGLNGREQMAALTEGARARASEATLTAQLRARDEALRVAREALVRWGLVRWSEDDDGGRFAKPTGRTLVRCRSCGAMAVEPDAPKHKKGCNVDAALAAIEEAWK